MKKSNLLITALLSGSLLAGCLDLSSDDKEALRKTVAQEFDSFDDSYADEENEEVSASDARENDYLGSTDIDASDTTGSARVGGEVAVSALEDQTQTANSLRGGQMMSRAQARTVDTLTADNFTVSFINGKGAVEVLTGSFTIAVHYPTADSDPLYIIDGLGDGVNYIVEVEVTVDGDAVNLKSVAYVPEGAEKSEKAVIDPISTVVAQAVEEKVISGYFSTGGDKFSQNYISDLNETMTAVIIDVITNNPEITITNFEVAITSEDGLKNLVSKLLADEQVNEAVDTLEEIAIEEQFEAPTGGDVDLSASAGDASDAGLTVAREYVGRLFSELFGGGGDKGEGGGGAPKLFVDFFGDKFEAGEIRTIQQVFDALASGLTPEGGGASPFTAAEQTAALTSFKSDFSYIYATLEQVENGTASGPDGQTLAEAKEELDDIPQMLLAIFPPSESATLASFTTGTNFNVPQAITMIFYVLDVYFEDEDDSCNDGNCDGGDSEGGDDDFNPFALLTLYGFVEADLAEYGGVDINWLGIHPGSMYIDGTGEVDVLNAYACIEDFLAGDTFDINSVTLTYPTAASSATINLVDESTYPNNGGGGGGSCWVWDTWQEQRLLEEDDQYQITREDGQTDKDWSAMAQYLVDNGKIISDFASGDYTVVVNYTDDSGSHSVTRTFSKKIITGLQQLNPRLTTPASQPRMPEGNVPEAEWEAFWTAQQGFVPTTFPAGAIGTIAWNAPEGLADAVPVGVIAAYNLDIGRSTDCDESGHCMGWESIFNTWEDNVQIFDTQFELPQDAKDQLVALELSDNNLYQINLGISFLDAETGEYLGNGGWSHAQFRVGESISGSDTFTISGTASNVPNADFSSTLAEYKVAMIEETCGDLGCTQSIILNADIAEDGSYELMPSFDQAKGTAGSWINIIMYVDADGDGALDNGEDQFWPNNHVNFNTWGGILRIGSSTCDNTTGHCDYSEEAVVPDGTYTGPSFDTQPQGAGTAN